jgi:hypothetical protein
MDLYQQNDSGIMMQTTTNNPNSANTNTNPTLGNLKPPKTPSRMYSRDRSNHSMSVAYSKNKNRGNEDLNESINHSMNNNQHLSRRNSSAANNLSVLDSDAQSLPQGTYAIKAGPQTVMSQWVITLDDGEDEDDEDDCDEDGDLEGNNNVEVCDDVMNNQEIPSVTGLLVQNHINNHKNNVNNNVSTVLSDPEEKWEDALASRLDLLSTSSVNNRNSPNPIKEILKQQQQNKLNESNISHSNSTRIRKQQNATNNNKYLQHSMSDNLVNYELNLNEAAEISKQEALQNLQQRAYNNLMESNNSKLSSNNTNNLSSPHKKCSTPSSSVSLPSPPLLPTSQPPPLNNSLDPFQTLLNQILADSGGQNKTQNENNKNLRSSNNTNGSISNINFNEQNNIEQHINANSSFSAYDKHHNPNYHHHTHSNQLPLSPSNINTTTNDLTQIKYLKNNYNIQYYPSDFVNFSQQTNESISPNSLAKTNGQEPTQSNYIPPTNVKPTEKMNSDFIINKDNNQVSLSNKSKNLLLATKPTNSNSSTTSTSSTSSSSSKLLGSNVHNNTSESEKNESNDISSG